MATRDGLVLPVAPDPAKLPGEQPSSARADALGTATAGERGTSVYPTGTGNLNGFPDAATHDTAAAPVRVTPGSPMDLRNAFDPALANGAKTRDRVEGQSGQPVYNANEHEAPNFGGTHGYSNGGVGR